MLTVLWRDPHGKEHIWPAVRVEREPDGEIIVSHPEGYPAPNSVVDMSALPPGPISDPRLFVMNALGNTVAIYNG